MQKLLTIALLLIVTSAIGQPKPKTDTTYIPVIISDARDTLRNVQFTYSDSSGFVKYCPKGHVIIQGKGFFDKKMKWQWYGNPYPVEAIDDKKRVVKPVIQVFQ